MLNSAKFSYFGIDLRPRKRRRAIIVCNWAAFIVAMVTLAAWLSRNDFSRHHPDLSAWLMLSFFVVFCFFGVFSDDSAFGGRKTSLYLNSLDDWARYRYGAALAELPEEQQQDVLRKYRVGTYRVRAENSKWPKHGGQRRVVFWSRPRAGFLRRTAMACLSVAGVVALSDLPWVGVALLLIGTMVVSGPPAWRCGTRRICRQRRSRSDAVALCANSLLPYRSPTAFFLTQFPQRAILKTRNRVS